MLADALIFCTMSMFITCEPTVAEVKAEIAPVSVEEAYVTSYSELDSCHYPGCLTASGKPAYIGAIACPRKYKLGTKVEIKRKTYTCEDRTAKRYDGRWDIFQGYGKEAHTKAINWGIQKLEVKILK